ncbi:uncharacterized protein JCM6883_005019 [Sporobolomyces salmoneus]|uniref:uncharacterized protein n=1 Tax=Sporobolomyces salmoneus TaxID=183962 RepID=UPI00316D286F
MSDKEEALSTLTALFPRQSTKNLIKYLEASNYNLERAYRATERGDEAIVTTKSKRRKIDNPGSGQLKSWLKKDSSEEAEVLVLSDSDEEPPSRSSSTVPIASSKPPTKSAFSLLRPPKSFPSATPTSTTIQANSTATHINLPPLRLTTAQMIAKETRGLITLVENALPEELASRLFVRMVEASRGTGKGDDEPWKRNKWYLVDREVESPHTSAFYVEQESTRSPEDNWNNDSYDLVAQTWYNGEFRQSRSFLPEMNEARSLVSAFVNTLLNARERNEMEWTRGGWKPNAAAANCYKGAQESVGWHSDQLTHLGPYAHIASITLGCTRPFRLRPFSPTSLPSTSTTSQNPTMRTLEITLPHNSLLIMWGGCQEAFKHCIPPVSGMDVFKLPKGSLGSDSGRMEEEVERLINTKWRERINMTFRHYRPDFAPLDPSLPRPSTSWLSSLPSSSSIAPTYIGTPHCSCGKPCILRPDGKGKIRSSSAPSSTQKGPDSMVFFWSCNAGAQNEGKGCGFFRVLDMEREGRGKWFVQPTSTKNAKESKDTRG